MTPKETLTLSELWRKLYGAVELPDDKGDIPMLRADVARIAASVDDLAGFYRTLRRVVIVGAPAMTIGAVIANALHII